MQRTPAFTLIELLVVIVIIGILSAISISAFDNFVEKARFAKVQSFESQIEKQVLAASTLNELGPLGKWDFNEGTSVANNAYGLGAFPVSSSDNWSTDTMENTGGQNSVYLGDGGSGPGYGELGLVASITSLTNGEVSFGFRFKLDSSNSQSRMIRISCSSGGGNEQLKFFHHSNNSFYFQQWNGATWTTIFTSPANSLIKLGQWHHVLVSYNALKATLYIDGELFYELDTPPPLNICSENFSSVYLGDSGVNGVDGYFDNLRIWKKAYIPE